MQLKVCKLTFLDNFHWNGCCNKTEGNNMSCRVQTQACVRGAHGSCSAHGAYIWVLMDSKTDWIKISGALRSSLCALWFIPIPILHSSPAEFFLLALCKESGVGRLQGFQTIYGTTSCIENYIPHNLAEEYIRFVAVIRNQQPQSPPWSPCACKT